MAIHRWSITDLDTNTVVGRGACESNYGDESLYEAFGALTGLGVNDAGINAVSDDLHARYGRTLGDGVELNIRPGENEHVHATTCGNYRLDLTVEPHA